MKKKLEKSAAVSTRIPTENDEVLIVILLLSTFPFGIPFGDGNGGRITY